MVRLDNAVAVVTGASSGIGEAVARALAARGSHVLLLARNKNRLDAIATDLRSRQSRVDVYAVDLANPDAVATTARAIISTFGPAHILVNNAGVGR